MVRYWLVRMKPDVQTDPDNDFWKIGLEENLIAIDWYKLGDITSFSEDDKDALVKKLKRTYPYYSDKKAITAASTILRFEYSIKVDHIALLPTYPEDNDGIIYLIGKVKSPAKYDSGHYLVTRDIEWITSISRNSISEPLKKSLNGRLAVFNIDKPDYRLL